MNVLIVEDNPMSSKVMAHTLGKHGYSTLVAADGDEAIESLEKHPDIDLLITDIVMPKSDGVQLINRIRERPEWSETPVLLCTSPSTLATEKRLAKENWNVIYKPVVADLLIAKVGQAIGEHRVVLHDVDETLSQTGMEINERRNLIRDFVDVLKKNIVALESALRDKTPLDPLFLREVIEGATLLRAERLLAALRQLHRSVPRRSPSQCNYPLLQRALKALLQRLENYIAQ